MSWWQAVILGVVEGITEYLPISSTGHLILAAALLGLDAPATKPALNSFEIVIQGGAILAVLGLYRARVARMAQGLAGRDPEGRRLLGHLLLAFAPAAILGPLLDDAIDAWLFHAGPVLLALFAGGVWMLWLARSLPPAPVAERDGQEMADLDWRRALLIGLLQCVSMWPGTSRSMMTIAGGMLLGLKPRAAAEFSFLLGVPTLGGACLFKLVKNLVAAHRSGGDNLFVQLGALPVLLGLLVATISAALAVKWLVTFLHRHGLGVFGWYRIALSVTLAALLAAGWVTVG